MIAHRLSTVREVDQILVLEKGQVQEQGTRRQLLEKGGLYAKMWKDYQQAAAWKVGNPAANRPQIQAADTGRPAAGSGKETEK